MKKILQIVTVICISTCLLTGCKKKIVKISADEFYEKVNSTYELTDMTSTLGYVKKAYAYNKDGLYFYFYEGNRSFDMGNIYIDEVENTANRLFDSKDKIDKGDNYSFITLYNDDDYYRIGYIDNTLIFAHANMNNRDLVDNLFEKCGF